VAPLFAFTYVPAGVALGDSAVGNHAREGRNDARRGHGATATGDCADSAQRARVGQVWGFANGRLGIGFIALLISPLEFWEGQGHSAGASCFASEKLSIRI
jgi:hypothetical protein